jgi:molybdopterin synthase sulfur carrier subunit
MSETVEVHLFAAARAALRTSMTTAEPGRLADILDRLEAQSPDFQRVRPRCSFLLDGVSVHGDPADVTVGAGARIDILPPFAGG